MDNDPFFAELSSVLSPGCCCPPLWSHWGEVRCIERALHLQVACLSAVDPALQMRPAEPGCSLTVCPVGALNAARWWQRNDKV